MTESVIQVENLSKQYDLGVIGSGTITRDFNRWWAKVRHKPDPYSLIGQSENYDLSGQSILALSNICFSVPRGQALGIIGKNGAGKSTLLKILSRVTAPTSGVVKVKGRIGSLLEVGTGFHPELTGRENVYLNGAILGMRKDEVTRKFDEIVAFSGVEKFIDTPVKRYSSGMYVRLAFAVAAHLDPEILIVDEVLAVGDAEFQKKCLGKMSDVAGEGRTVLFVSHNMTAIKKLCSQCIWLEGGSIKQTGDPESVVNAYLDLSDGVDYQGEMDLTNWQHRYGRGGVRITSAWLRDGDNEVSSAFYRSEPMNLGFVIQSDGLHELHFSATIVSETGENIIHLSHHDTKGLNPGVLNGRYLVKFTIPSMPCNEGSYQLTLAVHTTNLYPLDVVSSVLPFYVFDAINSTRPYKTVSKYAYCWTSNCCTIEKIHS